MSNEKQIIEVNGVRLEVDMRYARRVEELRIGSPVKVLAKSTYGGAKVHAGVVIGFEPFQDMPTILVAYVEDNYSTADVKIVSINSMQKDFDVVAAVDLDFAVDKNIIIARFERMLAAKQREIDDIQEKMEYFKNNFKAFWVKMERPTEEVTL
jgi:uncharacterized coiled-coil protein SlyX